MSVTACEPVFVPVQLNVTIAWSPSNVLPLAGLKNVSYVHETPGNITKPFVQVLLFGSGGKSGVFPVEAALSVMLPPEPFKTLIPRSGDDVPTSHPPNSTEVGETMT